MDTPKVVILDDAIAIFRREVVSVLSLAEQYGKGDVADELMSMLFTAEAIAFDKMAREITHLAMPIGEYADKLAVEHATMWKRIRKHAEGICTFGDCDDFVEDFESKGIASDYCSNHIYVVTGEERASRRFDIEREAAVL